MTTFPPILKQYCQLESTYLASYRSPKSTLSLRLSICNEPIIMFAHKLTLFPLPSPLSKANTNISPRAAPAGFQSPTLSLQYYKYLIDNNSPLWSVVPRDSSEILDEKRLARWLELCRLGTTDNALTDQTSAAHSFPRN